MGKPRELLGAEVGRLSLLDYWLYPFLKFEIIFKKILLDYS